MAFGTPALRVANANKTSSTTHSTTTTSGIAAGDYIVVLTGADNTATTDGTGHNEVSTVVVGGVSLTKAIEQVDANGAAAAGHVTSVWYGVTGSAISSGATVTVTYAAAKTAKVLAVYSGTRDTAKTLTLVGTDSAAETSAGGSDCPSDTTSGLTSAEHLHVKALSTETTTYTFTATSGYTAIAGTNTSGGSADTNISLKGEWDIATDTGSTSNPTSNRGNGVEWSTAFMSLEEVAAGGTNVDIVAATSTETAQTLSKTKTIRKTVTPGTSTETAQALSITHDIVKALTPATSTETAQPLTKRKRKTLGAATETDVAQVLAKTKTIRKTLTPATSSETAQTLSVTHDIIRTLTPATETDAAVSLSVGGPKTLGPALETDVARPLTFTKTIRKTLGVVTEADAAQPLTKAKRKTVVAATSTETAQALTKRKRVTLTPATETDLAVQLRIPIRRTLTPALETDLAVVLVSETGGEALTGVFDPAILRGRSGGRARGRTTSDQLAGSFTSAQSGRMEVE